MKRIFIVLLLAALLFAGCGKPEQQAQADTYRHISTAEAVEVMAEETDYIILDVRTWDEYLTAHIPGAICIPNETIGGTQPSQLPDKDQLILVYCRSGNRSQQAAQKLVDLGYTNIVEFGGIMSWTGQTVSGGAEPALP